MCSRTFSSSSRRAPEVSVSDGERLVCLSDGERLVWAASYALAFERADDAAGAVRAAARAVLRLREAANLRASDRLTIFEIEDERDFLDEIVNVP